MNITLKSVVKTVVIGGIAYGAGKLAMLGKLVLVCKDRPDDAKAAIASVCDMWSTLKEETKTDDTDNTAEEAEEEETAPVIEVTSAEEETEDLEDQPED
jgi:hypothetical protein